MQGTLIQEIAYRYKTVVVAVGGLVVLVKLAIVDDAISLTEADGIITAGLLVLTSLGVWGAKNGLSPTAEKVTLNASDTYYEGTYVKVEDYKPPSPLPGQREDLWDNPAPTEPKPLEDPEFWDKNRRR